MAVLHRIVPCLWFDNVAEQAVTYYVSVFKNATLGRISRYGEAGKEIHQQEPGTVLAIEFVLDGQPFMALNGGPMFKLSEAVSFQVMCESQAELDYYWDKLAVGSDPASQQCGWLKDQFGLSWQILPANLNDLLYGSDPVANARVMQALLQMHKLDIATLEAARRG
jgi:predicted 3-demethylubiquinone-9 3-methyltransferase (glyoxalase superfamily)